MRELRPMYIAMQLAPLDLNLNLHYSSKLKITLGVLLDFWWNDFSRVCGLYYFDSSLQVVRDMLIKGNLGCFHFECTAAENCTLRISLEFGLKPVPFLWKNSPKRKHLLAAHNELDHYLSMHHGLLVLELCTNTLCHWTLQLSAT